MSGYGTMSAHNSKEEKPDKRFTPAAYEKTVNYAISLLEVHGDYDTCLKYLKGVREKFEKRGDGPALLQVKP